VESSAPYWIVDVTAFTTLLSLSLSLSREHDSRAAWAEVLACLFGVGRGQRAGDVIPPGHSASPATARSACSNAGGNVRPRRLARRRIPAAAFGESEYLSDAFGSRIVVSDCDHENSPSTLGDGEVLRVENPEAPPIPALGHRVQDEREVPSTVARQEPFHVFHE